MERLTPHHPFPIGHLPWHGAPRLLAKKCEKLYPESTTTPLSNPQLNSPTQGILLSLLNITREQITLVTEVLLVLKAEGSDLPVAGKSEDQRNSYWWVVARPLFMSLAFPDENEVEDTQLEGILQDDEDFVVRANEFIEWAWSTQETTYEAIQPFILAPQSAPPSAYRQIARKLLHLDLHPTSQKQEGKLHEIIGFWLWELMRLAREKYKRAEREKNSAQNPVLNRMEARLRKLETGMKDLKVSKAVKDSVLDEVDDRIGGFAAELRAETDGKIGEAVGGVRTETDSKITEVRAEMDTKITEVRTETDNKITEVRTETDSKITEVRTETDTKITEVRTETDTKITEVRAETDVKIAQAQEQMSRGMAEATQYQTTTLVQWMSQNLVQYSQRPPTPPGSP